MSEKINFPTKLEEKLSIFDRIRKLMKRTSVTVDSNGKVNYISYPPRNGFSDKQKKNIETIEVNDVLILGDNRDTSLLELENLKTLVLGRGVIAVAEGAIPTTGLEELVVSDQAKQIPMGAISASSIRRVRGEGFDISTDVKAPTDIYFDLDGRPHFIQADRLASGKVDWMEARGDDPAKKSEEFMYALSESLIKNSSKNKNANTIYVYSETIGNERVGSIHAIADTFPMPSGRSENLDNDKLIGIYVTGTEEVDLSSLSQFSNLTQIVVGEDVKRVTGTPDLKTKGFDQDKMPQKTQTNVNGKEQTIKMMSDKTVVMMPMLKVPVEQTQEKTIVKEQDEMEL